MPVPEFPQSIGPLGSDQPPEPLAMHTKFFVRLIDTDTKTLESPHRIETIFASAIARNRTGPVRQGRQDDGAMGD